ncbi:MAG TPA: hypothetical protein VGM51_19415 [Armatimonadota bacterium]|jgi:hypothetical protein
MATAEYKRGMVLEPMRQPGTEQRLCVLMEDVALLPVHVKVAERGGDGQILLTGQEFVVPPSALELLRPIAGLCYEF